MKQILIATFFLILINPILADENGMHFEHELTWQQIKEKAKKENKYIFLDAYASWCGPCKWMSKEVFPQATVGDAINPNYVCAKFDMEKGEGITLAKEFNVKSYPTYLFFNPNGELVHRSLGSMPAKDFIELCNNSLKPEMQFIVLKKKYESRNRDTAFLRQYIAAANLAQDKTAQDALKEFLAIVDYELSPANALLVYNTTNYIQDTGYTIIQENKPYFEKLVGTKSLNSFIEDLVWTEAKKAGKGGKNKPAFKAVIQQYLPEKTDKLCALYDLTLLSRANDWKAYFPKAIAFAETFCKQDDELLNYVAGKIFENYEDKSALNKALNFALLAVEINNNADNNDTVAHIYQKLNKKTDALTYAKVALEKTKANGDDTHSLEEFIQTLQ
ncbi:MAG: thioredoxin family protein [Bacteroidetes bacterium]|nr:thioredoxin family protein [Bacteroidota bacterium]